MRYTSRAILINRQTGKILLIHCLDLESPSTLKFKTGFWVTPGGGVEDHENFEKSLRREIFEETGIQNIDIKHCVFTRIAHAEIKEKKQTLYYERYYIVETDDLKVSNRHVTASEKDIIKEYRWWSIEAIKSTNDIIFPLGLQDVIDDITTNKGHPIDISHADDLLKHHYSLKT